MPSPSLAQAIQTLEALEQKYRALADGCLSGLQALREAFDAQEFQKERQNARRAAGGFLKPEVLKKLGIDEVRATRSLHGDGMVHPLMHDEEG